MGIDQSKIAKLIPCGNNTNQSTNQQLLNNNVALNDRQQSYTGHSSMSTTPDTITNSVIEIALQNTLIQNVPSQIKLDSTTSSESSDVDVEEYKKTAEEEEDEFQNSEWHMVLNVVKHEMWPKLAAGIKKVILNNNRNKNDKIDLDDLDDECINKVINILKNGRYLSVEERYYLKKLIQRCREFTSTGLKPASPPPRIVNTPNSIDEIDNSSFWDNYEMNTPNSNADEIKKNKKEGFDYADELNNALLMDIFDIHRAFIFANFNFKEYTIKEYMNNIANIDNIKLPENVFEDDFENAETIRKYERLSYYPNGLVNDDIIDVFKYFFGASLYVNMLKHELKIDSGQYFVVHIIVIPSSMYFLYENEDGTCEKFEETFSNINLDRLNVYKTRIKSDSIEATDFADIIEQHHDINDIRKNMKQNVNDKEVDLIEGDDDRDKDDDDDDDDSSQYQSKLLIVVDRMQFNKPYDIIYIFSLGQDGSIDDQPCTGYIGFDFRITSQSGDKCVITHFKYKGKQDIHTETMRFYPEMLTSIIPRYFKKPSTLPEAKYLDKIYSHTFKHGWCCVLDDPLFNKYYKQITGVQHVSVNYNRFLLHNEFFEETPMLCFLGLLKRELRSHDTVKQNDIDNLYIYIDTNEYDTASIVDDIVNKCNKSDEYSNIKLYLKLKNKCFLFDAIKAIVSKYIEPAQAKKIRLCGDKDVFNVDKCYYIETIIDALKEFSAGNQKSLNVSEVLGAYDHVISLHGLCHIRNSEFDNHINDEKEELNELLPESIFQPFEQMQYESIYVQQYIVEKLNGYCQLKQCEMLQRHIMRRREASNNAKYIDTEDNIIENSLDEILDATLNALHCYILHPRKELFRLQRENGNSHFFTAMLEESDSIKKEKDNKTSNTVVNINFGVSVLEWLDESTNPQFSSFREEIIDNEQSTIDSEMYLNFSQECFLKLNNRKQEQYLLEELMSLKIYTDTNEFQSALRKAHWRSTSRSVKKTFYHWALQMYKTALFHAIPIPRWTVNSNAPQNLFHGLNRVFVMENARPKYHGPTSTSLEESVAHSFSGGIGLLWTIKPSYANKFRFVVGISVDWISQHKNEQEILLIDQIIPIASTMCFENDDNLNVDHLLHSIKSYQTTITHPNQFYKVIGIRFNESWIPVIKSHKVLYSPLNPTLSRTVLHVLVEDLKITQLSNEYSLLCEILSMVKLEKTHYEPFGVCCLTLQSNDENKDDNEYKLMSESQELVANDTSTYVITREIVSNNKLCSFQVRNQVLFGDNYIESESFDDQIFKNSSSYIFDNLKIMEGILIIYDNEKNVTLSNYRFTLIGITGSHSIVQQIKETDINKWPNKYNSFVYNFDASSKTSDLCFIVPYLLYSSRQMVGVYVQLQESGDFILFKQFTLFDDIHSAQDKITYLLRLLSMNKQKIKDKNVFFAQTGLLLDSSELELIKKHPSLYDLHVLEQLIEDLQLEGMMQFQDQYLLLSSRFVARNAYYADILCELKVNENGYTSHYREEYKAILFNNSEYKLVYNGNESDAYFFKHTNKLEINSYHKSFEIFVRNQGVFGDERFFLLQYHDDKWKENVQTLTEGVQGVSQEDHQEMIELERRHSRSIGLL